MARPLSEVLASIGARELAGIDWSADRVAQLTHVDGKELDSLFDDVCADRLETYLQVLDETHRPKTSDGKKGPEGEPATATARANEFLVGPSPRSGTDRFALMHRLYAKVSANEDDPAKCTAAIEAARRESAHWSTKPTPKA
jgi:hypothetical protein